jgi:hypothetical protein
VRALDRTGRRRVPVQAVAQDDLARRSQCRSSNEAPSENLARAPYTVSSSSASRWSCCSGPGGSPKRLPRHRNFCPVLAPTSLAVWCWT